MTADKPMPLTAEEEAHDRADWLVDAVAGSTQERAFLRGDPEEDKVWTESIYLNGKKAILVALQRQLSHRDAEIDRLRAELATAHDRGREAGLREGAEWHKAEALRSRQESRQPFNTLGRLAKLAMDIEAHETAEAAILSLIGTPAGADAGWRPTHRHYKGGLYRVIATGRNEADLSPVVVYDNEAGEAWVRPKAGFEEWLNFGDGSYGGRVRRFTPLPAAPSPQGGSDGR